MSNSNYLTHSGHIIFPQKTDITIDVLHIDSPDDETLEKAQINKYNKLIDLIQPKPGSQILEIGCGWGGFAEQLAKNYDVKLDCITISKKQYEFTKSKINRLGLNHKVNIKMLDYRDVNKKYDNIISIEMIEAVGEKYLRQYFKSIKENLIDILELKRTKEFVT